MGDLKEAVDNYLKEEGRSKDDLVMLIDDGMEAAYYTSFGTIANKFERPVEPIGKFVAENIFGILFDKYDPE